MNLAFVRTLMLLLFGVLLAGCGATADAVATAGSEVTPPVSIIETSVRVSVMRVDPTVVVTLPSLKPTLLPMTLVRTISGRKAEALKALVLDPQSYQPPSAFAAACPFAPDLVLRFESDAGLAWFLAARHQDCGGRYETRLAGAGDDLRRLQSRTLTAKANAALATLVRGR